MKTILTIPILFLISFSPLSAQTKLIAHKSHSGSLSNFSRALENDLFDISRSNFGMAPTPIIQSARLDTLIYLSDTSAVMITSEVCTRGKRKKYDSVWKAGKDTVYFHPLFCFQHKKDSIKKVLDKSYNFKNPADSVVMIGYDNWKPQLKKEPVVIKENKIISSEVKPSKKELRKARRALKRQKKKERKAEKARLKKIENHPEIKPASIIPVNTNPPNNPPGFTSLKIFLISIVAVLAIIVGVFKSKYSSGLKKNLLAVTDHD